MPVGFGFSIGDIISGLALVKDIIEALQESGGASAKYQGLIRELYGLERALLEVKRLELDESQQAQLVAVRFAASQCQRSIDGFYETIREYQPHLRVEGSGSSFKDRWKKIQWALCRKDDLLRFKAEVMGHTTSLNVLLSTVQLNTTAIEARKRDAQQQKIESELQHNALACRGMFGSIQQTISSIDQQGQNLMDQTTEIFRSNQQIFHTAQRIEKLLMNALPKSVEWQQPVTIHDARGRSYPFHLEFVISAEALVATLKFHFKDMGLTKIERGDGGIDASYPDKR
ncbi:MAG: hypothetical protein M1816_004126 [Peltula sp. TS41687]|nr:MAG: hypothetical protein M1816_004126 [Peltula sp. TS41687]